MIKRLEWNRKTASGFAVAAALIIVLTVALSPREIRIAENTMLDPVAWTFQRPSENTIIDDLLESPYSQGGLQATFHLWLSQYIEGVSDESDFLLVTLRINATVNNANGFIERVHIVAYKDQESQVDWQEGDFYLQNLSLVASVDGYLKSTQAYIKLAGVNHTSSISASMRASWDLLTPNAKSHQIEIACEIIYYNGTAYNKIVQPFQLNMIGSG